MTIAQESGGNERREAEVIVVLAQRSTIGQSRLNAQQNHVPSGGCNSLTWNGWPAEPAPGDAESIEP